MADLMNEVDIRVNLVGGKEAKRGLNELDKATERVVSTSQSFASKSNTTTKSVKRQADVNHIASRKTNAYGMAMQQAGYQVGDFIVQAQSGTNVMVAFGQQATQLVGILPMLAGQFNINAATLIKWSAGLGIIIPLTTALGAALMRTAQNAEEAEKAVDVLSTAVSDYSSEVDILNKSQSELNEEFGSFSEYATSAANALKTIALNEVNDQVEALANRFTDVSNLMGRQIPTNIGYTIREFLELNSGFKESNRLVAEFVNSQIALSQAEGPKQQAEALTNLIEFYTSLVGEQEDMTEEQEAYYLSLVKSLKKLAEFGAKQEDNADGTEKIADSTQRLNKLLEKGRQAELERNRVNMEAIRNKEEELRILQLVAEHGQESVEVVKARAEQEAIAKNLTTENQQKYIDLAVEIFRAKQAIEEMSDVTANAGSNASLLANEMSRAANEALRFISNLGSGAGLASAKSRVAGLRAELTARQGGAGDVEAAAKRARAQAMADPRTQLALQGPAGLVDEVMARIEREVETAKANAIAGQISGQISKLNERSSGGGGSARSAVDETDNLRESVNKLIASYDEEYAIKLKIEEATNLIAEAQRNDAIPANMEANQVLQDYIASLRDVEDPMMKIAQTARDELGDALMSIVDGTASAEDAFKNMARAILKQAFDLLVIKPLMDSLFGSSGIFGGFGSGGSSAAPVTGSGGLYANGGAFNNGNVIPFANGGVVSSPTMFPMAGQQTGVMGEAGPEAIMPLKRGKGGKLGVVAEGGQGDVRVENHFHIAANGDDSVKRIIEGEAPKLSAMALKTVMTERRKGGSMKQAFG